VRTVRRSLSLPHDSGTLGKGVRIAVLDTGVDADHPDLANCINHAESRAFTLHDDMSDYDGHGTHIAGIIAGSGAASRGFMAGIAPASTLVVYKIVHRRIDVEMNATAAVLAAIDAKVDIINYSHGYHPKDLHAPWLWSDELNHLEEAFELAAARGILCVVAAGNRGPTEGSITRPGGLMSVLTVASHAAGAAEVADTSSRGPYRRSQSVRQGHVTRYDHAMPGDAKPFSKPDIAVPGEGIVAPRSSSTKTEGDEPEQDPHYLTMSGTSQATAVASGLAAAALSEARANSVDLGANVGYSLRCLLRSAGSHLQIGRTTDFGCGSVLWPNLVARLRDFAQLPEERDRILHGTRPELWTENGRLLPGA
jgi:subtilisin family serine protease